MLTFNEIERLSSHTFAGWCFDDDAHGYYVRVHDRFMPKSCTCFIDNDYYAFDKDGYRLINKLALLPYDGSDDMTIDVSDITVKELQTLPAYAYCGSKGKIAIGEVTFMCKDAIVTIYQPYNYGRDVPCINTKTYIINNYLYIRGIRAISSSDDCLVEHMGVSFRLNPDGSIKGWEVTQQNPEAKYGKFDYILSDKHKSSTIINSEIERLMFGVDIPSLYVTTDCGTTLIGRDMQNSFIYYLCLNKDIADITKLNAEINGISYEGRIFTRKNQIEGKLFSFIYIDNGVTVNFIKQLLKSLHPNGILCIKGIESSMLPKILSTIPEKYSYMLFDSDDIPCLAIQNIV